MGTKRTKNWDTFHAVSILLKLKYKLKNLKQHLYDFLEATGVLTKKYW